VPPADKDEPGDSALLEVLEDAREAGFLGPGPVDRHLQHAKGFTFLVRAEMGSGAAHLVDLGSGGGLPGLVIATDWPAATLVLLESNQRRAQFLEQAVRTCRLEGRVRVIHERAEICGRNSLYRANFDGVVARSFGSPAVVAECAAPFLRVGGWLIVSEPPDEDAESQSEKSRGPQPEERPWGSQRWPADQLAQFGLEPMAPVRLQFGYQILRQRQLCPDAFPRRNGVPSKRPLF
jgi:16S rRNA (guanine527-N7)-methyltransferase